MIKSTGVIGAATAFSRVLGFVRDIVIANFFGTGIGAQAFVVAFRIPNMFRDLVGEGAANAAIVPVMSEYEAKSSRSEFAHLFRTIFNLFFIGLSVITVLGVLFSPLIVRLMAPGFAKEPAKFFLTVGLSRLIFPYIFLIGLTAITMAALNTLRHFAVPAFGASMLNITLIISALWLGSRFGIYALGIGVIAGGVLQLGMNIPVLYRKGLSLDLRAGFRHPANKKIALLLIPRILGSAVYQLNIFVDTILASLAWIVGAGGVAALYYANRFIQFPLGIFSIALAQAALPKMSREAAAGDMEGLKDTLSFSLRMICLIILPSSFGLALLGRPIIKILFERGQFDSYSTWITQNALFFYAFGLAAFSGIKILVSCFYSMHDTITPVKTAGTAVFVNVILNLILMWPLKLGGLALATSISATLNFFMLFFRLKKKIGPLDEARLIDSFVRIFLASAVMGLAASSMVRFFRIEDIASSAIRFGSLLAVILAAAAVFVLASIGFGVKEMKDLAQWVSKKR